jgi:tetratricopeptide (TPR) repeat protein
LTARSLTDLGLHRERQSDLSGARTLFDRALSINKKVLGHEHRDTAMSLNILGRLLWKQGDLAGARSLLERALPIHQELLGAEDPRTVGCLTEVYYIALAMKDEGKAETLRERAVAIWQDIHDWKLASGAAEEAVAYANVALAAHERALGPNHPWTIDSAEVTADALDALGRTEEARPS